MTKRRRVRIRRGAQPPPAAVRLFVDRAEAVRPGVTRSVEPTVLAELVTRLDGLPLAIELAAARSRLLPPSALLDRLGSRLDLLTGGARDLPERQRTLRATLDWSHDLLGPDEQRLFARLSVFRGGARLADAERVASPGLGGNFLDLVGSVVDKSLVQAMPGEDEPRLAMLEIVREYASERLGASGEQGLVEDRRDEVYADLATAAHAELRGPRQGDAMRRLEREVDNLRAAVRHSLDAGRPDRALALVWEPWQFWWLKGHLTEARAWLDELGASPAEASLDASARVALDTARAVILFWAAQLDAAARSAERAIETVRRSGDPSDLAMLLLVRGMAAAFDQADSAAARADVAEARRIVESLQDRWLAGFVWSAQGYLTSLAGDVDATIDAMERAAEEAAASGDRVAGLVALDTLGRLHLRRGEIDRAAERFGQALAIALEHGLTERFGYVLSGVAALLHSLGDDRAAARYIGASNAAREAIIAVWLVRPAADEWEEVQREVRMSLGDPEFAVAAGEGRGAGAEAVAREALERLEVVAAGA